MKSPEIGLNITQPSHLILVVNALPVARTFGSIYDSTLADRIGEVIFAKAPLSTKKTAANCRFDVYTNPSKHTTEKIVKITNIFKSPNLVERGTTKNVADPIAKFKASTSNDNCDFDAPIESKYSGRYGIDAPAPAPIMKLVIINRVIGRATTGRKMIRN